MIITIRGRGREEREKRPTIYNKMMLHILHIISELEVAVVLKSVLI